MQQSPCRLLFAASVALAAIASTPAHAAQPVAAVPIRQLLVVPPEPEGVRASIVELKSACARWIAVPEPGASVAPPVPTPPGPDGTICSFVRDPEGAGWQYGIVGAVVTVVALVIGAVVLGAASAALRLGWRAFDRVVGGRRTLHAGDVDVA